MDLQGIILAFAGRVLLQRTNFSLERGKVYGIVGQSGTERRPLRTGSPRRTSPGFAGVSVYYIGEILSEKQETIVDFMVANVPDGVTRETINTLKKWASRTSRWRRRSVPLRRVAHEARHRAPCFGTPRCCSWTSPPTIWTPPPSRGSPRTSRA